MVKHLLLVFFIIGTLSSYSSPLQEEELDLLYKLMDSDPDSAYKTSYNLLESTESDDYFGLVKLNYILGYMHNEDHNVGKAVVHYLEAIRYSEEASYEGIQKDAVSVRKNLAAIYRSFNANELAINYYKDAIEIADWSGDSKKVISLKFSLGLTYVKAKHNHQAISLFEDLLEISSKSRKYRIINELGLLYEEIEDFDNSRNYFQQLLNIDNDYKLYTAKALHNLGRLEYKQGNEEKAIALINSAIDLKENIEKVEKRSLFISYKTLGEFLYNKKDFDNSLIAYQSAESLVEIVKQEPLAFELYRSLSQLSYEMNDSQEARKYNNLYSVSVENYLESQKSVQETDRQYNMDLITKRYLDQVKKQEQIADILFYSKTISGSLLALLLLTVGYNRYQKVKLRKSILEDLIRLKVVD